MSEGIAGATPPVAGAPVTTPQSPVGETPAQAEARKFKVKVNNQEMEVDERELITGYQTRKASDEKFRQGSELSKKAMDIHREYDEMAQDPEKFFRKNGKDPHEWAEQILLKKLKLEQMSPEQREALEIRQENERLKKEKADRDKELDDVKLKGVTSQAVQALDTELATALQAANLDKIEPAFIARVADKMLAYHDKTGGERMPAAKAVELVKAETEAAVLAMAKRLPVDELMRLLSDQSDAIRKHFVSQVVDNGPMRQPKARNAEPVRAKPAPKRTSTEDFFKKLDNKFS